MKCVRKSNLSFEHVLNLGEHITSSKKPFHMPQFRPASAWLCISWTTNQPNSITFKRALTICMYIDWLFEQDMLASDHFVSFVYLSFIKFVQSSLLRSQAFTKPCLIQPWTWKVWTLNLKSLPSWNRVLLRENCLHEEGMSLQYYSWSLTGILILKFGVLFFP
jgi:hypothetical protein